MTKQVVSFCPLHEADLSSVGVGGQPHQLQSRLDDRQADEIDILTAVAELSILSIDGDVMLSITQ